MPFEDIIGQKKASSFLQDAIKRQAFSNAYLFSGPEGVGKAAVAKEFASLIADRYDIECVEPEGSSETISIKIARDISTLAGRSPYSGNYKVFIIIKAEHMTEEAANSLLKTLEEPQRDTVFILTTSNITKILPTVVSRCQVVRFGSLKTDEVARLLTTRYGLDETRACLLARLANGKPGRTIEMLNKDWLSKRQEVLKNFAQGSKSAFFSYGGEGGKDRDNILETIEVLQSIFRDVLFKICLNDLSRLAFNLDIPDLIKNIALKQSCESILNIAESLNRIEYYLRHNGNPKLAMAIIGLKFDMAGIFDARGS